MSFASDKETLIAHLKQVDCNKVPFIEAISEYGGLYQQLEFFIETFNCIPDALKAIIELFDDDTLLSYGIYYQKTGDVTNPKMVIDGNHDEIILSATVESIYILAGTTANKISVLDETRIQYMLISGDSVIAELSVDEGSTVDFLSINTCKTFNTRVENLNNCETFENVTFASIEARPAATTTVPATTTTP